MENFKHYLNTINRVIFLLLIVFAFLISCEYSTDNVIGECLTESETTIASDPRILCVGQSVDVGTTCLREANGNSAEIRYINQMYANVFAYIQKIETNIEDKDAIDSAAISADCLFSDCSLLTSWEGGDGFGNNKDPDDEDYNEGGSAASHCVTKKKFSTSKFDVGGGSWYGMNGNEVDTMVAAGLSEIPAVFVCSGPDGAGYDSDKFNLAGNNNPNGLIVTQRIPNVDGNDYDQYKVFYCDEDHWVEWDDIVREFDADGDGAPGGLNKAWDCDDNNPNVKTDLSVFVNQDDETVGGAVSEICDDGVANTCQDSNLYEVLDVYQYGDYVVEVWDEDVDNCDNNPYACENNCLTKDGKCSYLDYVDETSDSSVTTTIGTGFCCGNNLNDDLGSTAESSAGVSNICLNQNFVTPDIAEFSEPSSDGWDWLDAEVTDFKIFTINYLNKDAKTSFDIVSDSKEWQVCKDTEAFLDGSNYGNTDANRFICYQEGDHYSFVECSAADSATTHNGVEGADSVKQRIIAEGEFSLPLIPSSTGYGYSTDLSKLEGFNADYQDLYTVDGTLDQTIDFTGFDYLEFYVKYLDDEIELAENIHLKITGLPQVYGEGNDRTAELEPVTYFDQNVLGYAVNQPLIEKDHVIHVRVPVAEWPDIKEIQVTPYSEHNTIEVLAMYLTTQADIDNDAVNLCSGEASKF